MLYVQINARLDGVPVAARVVAVDDALKPSVETRNDWKTFGYAQAVARALGTGYTATDEGPHTSPRYDVIRVPQVGDDVSYGFNGDYYPSGTITKVSKSGRRVVTSKGDVFYRKGVTGSWKMNGTWFLVRGTHNERNPHF